MKPQAIDNFSYIKLATESPASVNILELNILMVDT